MINKKEVAVIVIMTIIFAFLVSIIKTLEVFLYSLLAIFLVILTNIFAKKMISFYLDSAIEIKLWEFRRYGYKPHQHLKRAFPLGVVLPIITAIITLGYVVWLASLVFYVKPKTYRAAKRFGLYTFSEMTEHHIGMIAAAGIAANLVFAIIGYLLGFSDFARLNIYYAFFNMIPISNLDGNKIFFGSLTVWSFLAVIVLIALGYAFLLV